MIGKETRRGLIIAVLIVSFIISIIVIIEALKKNEWGTIAGALAVIAAIISAAMSQPIIWKQEDDAEPDINIFFDLDSLSGIIQLRLINSGGSNAYDVKIEWNKPVYDVFKEEVNFSYIPVMTKNEGVQVLVNETATTFQDADKKNRILTFEGNILFKLNKNDKSYKIKFFEISLEQYRKKLSPTTDFQDFMIQNKNFTQELITLNLNLKQLMAIIKNQNSH